jgi:molybdopterin-guanine dinucleotide biosynthesis protein A
MGWRLKRPGWQLQRLSVSFMSDIEGFILTGGASSRMGTDKARLLLGAQTFIERIHGALSSITPDISVVSARPERFDLSLPVVADIHRDCGALGGLHAALSACRAPWAVIVSCDLPFVTGELFARLVALCNEETDAVAPLQADGRPQPLCTLYSPAGCLERVERLLQEGERRPRVLLRQVRTRWVAPTELSDLRDAELFFMNVNTPEDYRRACERAGEKVETMNEER